MKEIRKKMGCELEVGNFILLKEMLRDCPGGPVVKTFLSKAVGVGSIPSRGWGGGDLDSTCLMARKPKHKTETIL